MSVFHSRRFWIGAGAALGFLPLVVLPRQFMFDIVNALTVAVGVGVLIAYLPGICRSLQELRWDGTHYLVLGIFVTWSATALRHLWNWIWRFLGKPAEMIDHPIVAFLVWMTFMGGVLHMTARGALDGEIPRENWIRLGVVIAAGIVTGLLVIVFLEPASPPAIPRLM
jgi:hypothetical protein